MIEFYDKILFCQNKSNYLGVSCFILCLLCKKLMDCDDGDGGVIYPVQIVFNALNGDCFCENQQVVRAYTHTHSKSMQFHYVYISLYHNDHAS